MLSNRWTVLNISTIIVALWCVVRWWSTGVYEIWNLLIVNSLLSPQYIYWLATYPPICLISLPCPRYHVVCSVVTCPLTCLLRCDLSTCMPAELWPIHASAWPVHQHIQSVMTGEPAWRLNCDLSSSLHYHDCSVMTCPPTWLLSYDLSTSMAAQSWPVHQHGCSVMTCPPAWLLSCDLSTSMVEFHFTFHVGIFGNCLKHVKCFKLSMLKQTTSLPQGHAVCVQL